MKSVFLCVCILCSMTLNVLGQVLGCSGVGWDHLDPVNIAESRVYARLFYEFKETGVVSQEFSSFRFTNPGPTGAMTPFYGAEEFFRKLYAHRLNYSERPPNYYILDDLLRDDPAVEAAFRLYATTGRFETPFDGDLHLALNHLDAVVDASSTGVRFDFSAGEQTAIVDGTLESFGLFAKAAADGGSVDEPEFLPIDIQSLRVAQRLPVLPPGNPPYWPDNEAPCPPGVPDNGSDPADGYCISPGHPGFDCDDYARAWAAWLKRHLTEYPNAEYFLLSVCFDTVTGRDCHMVVALLINGKYYIVDPQTGAVRGPLAENWFVAEDFGPLLKKLLVEKYHVTDPGDVTWELHPPDYIDPRDVQPWYTDPAVLEWWRRMFPGQDPQEYVWPGILEVSHPPL